MEWYIVHTTPNYEKKVKERIMDKASLINMREHITEVLVPEEEVISMKAGKKVISNRRIYPSYIFINMDLNDQLWHLIKRVPNVTGFVGGNSTKPAPMRKKEIDDILKRISDSHNKKPAHKIEFTVGETLRVKEGSFTDFQGTVLSVNYERNKLAISILIFGRETPLDVDFSMVEKL